MKYRDGFSCWQPVFKTFYDQYLVHQFYLDLVHQCYNRAMTSENKKRKRYRPVQELGSGGFATVYLAVDEKLSRKVAVKVFHGRNDNDSKERFSREVQICKRLSHPNIIKIYDASTGSKNQNIVMEYIDGENLFEIMERRNLTLKETLSVIRQTANALAYLHENDIIHRDIKPENIMIQEPMRAILMDFNLAFSEQFTMLTEEGFTVGTPRFMAPELFVGVPSSVKSDVFSLGLVFYDLLTNGSVSTAELCLANIHNRILAKPSSFDSRISKELDSLISWSTANAPDDRCPSMEDFLDALGKLPENEEGPLSPSPGKGQISPVQIDTSQKPQGLNKGSVGPGKPQGKTWKYSGLRLLAFLVVLFSVLYFASTYVELDFILNHQPSKALSTEETSLFTKARRCSDGSYDSWTAFIREEDEVFKSSLNSSDDVKDHLKDLRSIVNEANKGSSFRLFTEYLYRLRQNSVSSNNDEPSENQGLSTTTRLLEKCLDLHWSRLTGSSSVSEKQLSIGHLIFNEHWMNIVNDRQASRVLVDKMSSMFFKLDDVLRRTDAGKAFFHSLALCQIYWDKDFGGDNSILFCRTPYDGPLLSEIRSLVLEKHVRQTPLTSFSSKCQGFANNFRTLLKEAEKKKVALQIRTKQDNNIHFLSRMDKTVVDIADEYDEIVKLYIDYIDLGWFILSLGDDRVEGLDYCLVEAIRHCLAYTKYRFEFLYTTDPGTFGENGPGSLAFTLRYLPRWTYSAHHYLKEQTFDHGGYIIANMNSILIDAENIAEESVYVLLSKFLGKVKKDWPLTGSAMNTLFSRYLKTELESTSSISNALTELVALEKGLSLVEFRGWSVLTVILSNELFLRLKKEKRLEERLERSLNLLHLIDRRYPNRIFNGFQFTFRHSAPDCLRQSTLVHCCDAYLSKGLNFFEKQPVLAGNIRAEKLFTFLLMFSKKGEMRGGSLAAAKLMKNEVLKAEDILVNPLGYR